jgi:hypothetical protein
LPRSNPARVAIRLERASRRAVRDDVDVEVVARACVARVATRVIASRCAARGRRSDDDCG